AAIHGSAPGFLAKKFNNFNLLEGRVYGINGWQLKDTNAFKITDSSHKFEFGEHTNIYEIVDDNYPRCLTLKQSTISIKYTRFLGMPLWEGYVQIIVDALNNTP
ncbi:ribosomal RNA small subunit methyltransferase H, partial [Striga asiatica]